jgi:hypothetical protein
MPTRTGPEGESSRTREGVRRGSLGEGGRGAGRREQPRMMRWTRAVGRAELAAEATKTAGDGGRREDESGGRGRGHGEQTAVTTGVGISRAGGQSWAGGEL